MSATLTLLHLSDTHFGSESPAVADALLRLSEQQQPTMAILSGDITQRARRAEFAAAARFLQGLAKPVLALPGNHDIPLFNLPVRLLSPYGPYRRALRQPLTPTFASDALLVIGVNTTRWFRHKDGEVSPEQIEQVGEQLKQAQPSQLRVVVTHQPVHVTSPRDQHNLLHGHQEAVRAWSAAGADLILGGHIHLPYVRNLREHDTTLPRDTWCVQAGTAVSTRVRFEAPNSVNLIRYQSQNRSGQVERWDYDGTRNAFALHETTRLVLAPA